jgi:hypothetical protein
MPPGEKERAQSKFFFEIERRVNKRGRRQNDSSSLAFERRRRR